jgi:hypothetical protein
MIRRRTGTRILYSKHRDLTVADPFTTSSPAQSFWAPGDALGTSSKDRSAPTMSSYCMARSDRA